MFLSHFNVHLFAIDSCNTSLALVLIWCLKIFSESSRPI